ncbi:MAG: glycosyltransferase family 2 protein [Thermodesulfobacteriota bacterium]
MEFVDGHPLASVVMISWNRKDILRRVLAELRWQTYPACEIVLADNGSTDGAPEMVMDEFPEVRLLRLSQNLGIKAYNLALENCSGETVVILDSDSFLENEGIAKIVYKFMKYPALGALGCKVYYYDSGRIHHWHPTVRQETGPEEGFHSPLFNGCAAAVRRAVVEEVGFYPEEFFLYENERDLCTRIINAGYEVRYFTDISGYHMVPDETGRSDRLIYYSTRNLLWYSWKHLPAGTALRRTASLTAYSAYLALQSRRPMTHLRPVLAGLVGLPSMWRHRNPVRRECLPRILY